MSSHRSPLIWRKSSGPVLPDEFRRHGGKVLQLAVQFADFAAKINDLAELGREVCRVAAAGLNARFAMLLIYAPDQRQFIVRAGSGWRDGVDGARLDADFGTAAGFARLSDQAVISNDLVNEARFRIPSVQIEHRITRSIDVVVSRQGEPCFGVLEVASPEPGAFTDDDMAFLQLLAGSLAAATERSVRRERSEQEAAGRIDDHQKSYAELCHRFRNDLQVIGSSIDRAGRAAGDGPHREASDRIQRQIGALATLYDHLLEHTETDDAVDLGAYLQLLCRRITEASDLPSRGIDLGADMQSVTMRPSRAVQIGIAVNELVANAAEHAFRHALSGRILVRLRAKSGEQAQGCILTVADNGCGFNNPGIDGAGLGFVARLAGRAGAELTREDGEGTLWRLDFAA